MRDSLHRPAGTLEHGPVILRRWQAGDEDAAYQSVIESQAHLRPWMPWAVAYTRQDAVGFVAACERDWQSGAAYNYAITTEGQVAGSCGLMARIGPAAWRSVTGSIRPTFAGAWPRPRPPC